MLANLMALVGSQMGGGVSAHQIEPQEAFELQATKFDQRLQERPRTRSRRLIGTELSPVSWSSRVGYVRQVLTCIQIHPKDLPLRDGAEASPERIVHAPVGSAARTASRISPTL